MVKAKWSLCAQQIETSVGERERGSRVGFAGR